VRFCAGAGATLLPSSLWGFGFSESRAIAQGSGGNAPFYLRPRYRTERPLDSVLAKVDASLDRFPSEKYADKIDAILARWSASLLQSASDASAISQSLATDFSGSSPRAVESAKVRYDAMLEVSCSKFSDSATLNRESFLREWHSTFADFFKILVAEFQITAIDAGAMSNPPGRVETRIRYEIVGKGAGFYR